VTFLYDEQVAAWLNALTARQFVEFFYSYLAARRIECGHEMIPSHLVLGEVMLVPISPDGFEPVVELLCPPPKPSDDEAPIKWRGVCCGFQTAGWRRFATCPVCGEEVRDA
jgi:hypothetical protein